MKESRQQLILDAIAKTDIETQNQLIDVLREAGVRTTQATISRDIKELHLVKEPIGQGRYKYGISENRAKLNFAEKLQTIFRESITTIDYAQNIVVVKTMPGLASAACSALDSMHLPMMLGSIAGDDTAMLVMKSNDAAAEFCEDIRAMLL